MGTKERRVVASIPWGIYHQEREFAREMGDPCLGIVSAQSKREAEIKARRLGLGGPTGLWANPLPKMTGKLTSGY